MRKVLNPLFALPLIVVFLSTAILCCCINRVIQDHTSKSSCCSKTSKTAPDNKCTDGCSSIVKSAETAKAFSLGTIGGELQVPTAISAFSFKPVNVIASVFLNGPPGPVSSIPLYTQFHSLRI